MEVQAHGSRDVARIAILMCISKDRDEERALRSDAAQSGVKTAAVDYGGEFVPSLARIMERAVVAAKREGVIDETHHEEGAVAGAAHEAVSQITNKALGLNVGGKIGIARFDDHVAVAIFFGIGLLHLNEVAVGLGHRTI